MLPHPPNYDHLALDFDTVRQRLKTLAGSAFPEWTDHDTPGFGNVLLDLFAYVTEVLGYYIESQGREGRLATVTQRANALAHARALGYHPRGTTAARAVVVFTLAKPAENDVVIPAGYVVRTQDVTPPVRFRVIDAIPIPKGIRQGTGSVEASILHKQVVDTSGAPDLGVVLIHRPYLDGSLAVSGALGETYQEVATFLDSTGQDRHVTVRVDENEQATVCFGNGILGMAPTGRLDITYKTGGGSASCVDAHTLVVADDPVFDTSGKPVLLSVTNSQAAGGGSDRESVESIRLRAPEHLRVAHRTITREDFEINARKLPGIARALMLTSNEEEAIEENTGRLFIVPEGGGPLTDELKAKVLHQVTQAYPCTLTFQVDVEAPTYVPIHIEAEVDFAAEPIHDSTWLSADARGSKIETEIHQRLRELFAISLPDGCPNPRTNFGFYLRGTSGAPGEVAWSDVVSTMAQVPGVRKVARVTLNGAQQDIVLKTYAFPVLGEVVLRRRGSEG